MKVTVTKTDVVVEGDANEIRDAVPSILTPNTTLVVHGSPSVLPPATAPGTPGDVEALPAPPPSTELKKPVSDWMQIPEHLRAWNATGDICHIVLDPENPTSAVCGHDLGLLRDPSRDPMNTARPCAGCNRAIERMNRK